jgi:hypothetical protein
METGPAGWVLVTSVMVTLVAGDVSGTITAGGRPIAPGVPVEIKCGSAVYSALTDSLGHYRVYVSHTGRCTLSVTYQGRSLSAEVYSYDTPVRYDWSVEASGATYHLRRT